MSKNTHSEQSRLNGAKSKGPISIDGKARSSRNSLKHGFAAVINIVLSIEDKPAFELHLQGFRAGFLPRNYVEQSMVEQLASINWRQSRLVALETALIDAQIAAQEDAVSKTHPNSAHDDYLHLVLAWQALASQPSKPDSDSKELPEEPRFDINSLELVRRYQVSLDRQYRNVLLNLRQYRSDFFVDPMALKSDPVPEEQPAPEPDEPNTVPPAPFKNPPQVVKHTGPALIIGSPAPLNPPKEPTIKR